MKGALIGGFVVGAGRDRVWIYLDRASGAMVYTERDTPDGTLREHVSVESCRAFIGTFHKGETR
jgi:hypothetical protein